MMSEGLPCSGGAGCRRRSERGSCGRQRERDRRCGSLDALHGEYQTHHFPKRTQRTEIVAVMIDLQGSPIAGQNFDAIISRKRVRPTGDNPAVELHISVHSHPQPGSLAGAYTGLARIGAGGGDAGAFRRRPNRPARGRPEATAQ